MNEINDKDLNEIRKKIDKIDNQLLMDLEERFELVADVARIKKEKGLPIRDLAREEEVIKSKFSKTDLPEDFVAKLYRLIIDEAIRQENEK